MLPAIQPVAWSGVDDSMTDAGIPAGTLVFVHPHRAPQMGRPCAVLRRTQGALIKQFRGARGGKIVLWQYFTLQSRLAINSRNNKEYSYGNKMG